MSETSTAKRCKKCGLDKPLAEYYRAPANADGLQGSCRACTDKRQQAYNKAHPEEVRAHGRERQSAYAAAHPEEVRERTRRYFLAAETETTRQADHHGERWTVPEMELAARSDLTAKQAALMTGRTFNAVRNMRRRLSGAAACPPMRRQA